jgi:hypothetical protein
VIGGFILLQQSVREVASQRGAVGERAASKWWAAGEVLDGNEESEIEASARILFHLLETGELTAYHTPKGKVSAEAISPATWGCHGYHKVEWSISAIRDGYISLIENIKVNGSELRRSIERDILNEAFTTPAQGRSEETPKAPGRRRGRAPVYDWGDVELFVRETLDAKGDFDEANQAYGWTCQADLERLVVAYIADRHPDHREPAISTVRANLTPMIKRWRSDA